MRARLVLLLLFWLASTRSIYAAWTTVPYTSDAWQVTGNVTRNASSPGCAPGGFVADIEGSMSLTFSGSAIEVYAPQQDIVGYFLMDGASTSGGLQDTPQDVPGCLLLISWSNLDPGIHHTLTLSTLHGPTPGFPIYSPQMVINYVRYNAPEPVPSMPPVDVPSQTVTPDPPSSSPSTTTSDSKSSAASSPAVPVAPSLTPSSASFSSPSISTTVLQPSSSSSTTTISSSTPPSNPLSLSVASPSLQPGSQTTPAQPSSTTAAVPLGGSASGSSLKVVLASTAGGTILISAIGVGAVLLYRRRRGRPQPSFLAPKGSLRAYPVLPAPPKVLRDVRIEKLAALFQEHEIEKGGSPISSPSPSPVYKS